MIFILRCCSSATADSDPSCLALAQALSRRQADEAAWTDVARPFTLAAWALSPPASLWRLVGLHGTRLGRLLGMDPVKRLPHPWLIATAALHTMLIQTRRNKP